MESCFLTIVTANYWRHFEMTNPDTTIALVIITSVIAITILHSATNANAIATISLPWRQLAAEFANVARPGTAGRMLTLWSSWRLFRCWSD